MIRALSIIDILQGIYIELEDGRKVIDAVGGAAVTCIGNGHPEVVKAIQDQIETLACVFAPMMVLIVRLKPMEQTSTICNYQTNRQSGLQKSS
jgi:adenosylmethionine-8-amino-7-oxononanoate aminotransferase